MEQMKIMVMTALVVLSILVFFGAWKITELIIN